MRERRAEEQAGEEGVSHEKILTVKALGRFLVVIVLAILLAGAAAWVWLHKSLPQVDGEIRAPGLAAAVEVIRDAEGVPHIFAKSDRDGWYAIGYAHAQDRLWQMEFQRRVADGRLSEFLGELSYDTDRLMRTVGMSRTANAIVAKLDPETRAALDAYAAGVNGYLASDPVLPIEFQVFRIKPQPWKPADSVSWLLVMAWDLSANWRTELGRLRYAARLGQDRAAQLIPPYPGDKEAPLPDFSALWGNLAPAASALLEISPPTEHAIGSNNWVVS